MLTHHVLARHVPREEIDAEVVESLDAIARVAESSEGRGWPGLM